MIQAGRGSVGLAPLVTVENRPSQETDVLYSSIKRETLGTLCKREDLSSDSQTYLQTAEPMVI